MQFPEPRAASSCKPQIISGVTCYTTTRPALAIHSMWFKERVVGFPNFWRMTPSTNWLTQPMLPVSNSRNVTCHPDKTLSSTISVERVALWIFLIDLESWKWMENGCSQDIWPAHPEEAPFYGKTWPFGDCSNMDVLKHPEQMLGSRRNPYINMSRNF